MKKNIFFTLTFLLPLMIINLIASDYVIKEGFVSYSVKAKTFGLIADNIVGINNQMKGDVSVLDGNISGKLIIPVASFESGNSRRDRDVAKILKYDEHPDIIFEIYKFDEEEINKNLNLEKGTVKLKGKLNVAGVEKIYDFKMDFIKINNSEIKVTTEIESKFSDFGIKPPRFGLVIKRAPDQVFLRGEIIFKTKTQ